MITTTHTPGTCRFCHCTESNPCVLPNGDPCSWFDMSREVCNAPACIRQRADRIRAAAHAAFRPKRTPADIERIKLEERRARARRSRAAARIRQASRR
jgi:hypothetical protein